MAFNQQFEASWLGNSYHYCLPAAECGLQALGAVSVCLWQAG